MPGKWRLFCLCFSKLLPIVFAPHHALSVGNTRRTTNAPKQNTYCPRLPSLFDGDGWCFTAFYQEQFLRELYQHLRCQSTGQARQPVEVRETNRRRRSSLCFSGAGRWGKVGRDTQNGRQEGALSFGTISVQGAVIQWLANLIYDAAAVFVRRTPCTFVIYLYIYREVGIFHCCRSWNTRRGVV